MTDLNSTLAGVSARNLPLVMSIAGSDCSAGAGIQADLKTITALGGHGFTVLTSVVAETSVIVDEIELLNAKIIQAQIRVLLEAYPIAAAKTGMLGSTEQIEAVTSVLSERGNNFELVVDPVMVATSGAKLLVDEAVHALCTQLFPIARVLTPNLDEAAVLLGKSITTREEMLPAALELQKQFGCAILLKGGHLPGGEVPDLLVDGQRSHWWEGTRINDVNTHGTGCTYSAAIATGLALGYDLFEAVDLGKKFVTRAIAQHLQWNEMQALNQSARQITI